MENIKKIKIVNIVFLVVAALAAGIILKPVLEFIFGLPILLIMFFGDNPGGSISMQGFRGYVGNLLFEEYFIYYFIPVMIFFASLFLFIWKKYIWSIFACILIFIGSVAINNYVKIQKEQKTKMLHQEWGILPQNIPASGFLVPTPTFVPDSFKEVKRTYTNGLIIVSWEAIDQKGIKSKIIFSEEFKVQQVISYADLLKSQSQQNLIIQEFKYEEFPGFIEETKTGNTPGYTTYILYWDDNGKLASIKAYNVSKSDFDPEKIKAMLKKLERA